MVGCVVGEGAGAWRDKDWVLKGATETKNRVQSGRREDGGGGEGSW